MHDWQSKAAPLIGKLPDTQIARELGVTPRQVGYLRSQQGKAPACRGRWGLEVVKRLGVDSDAALAAELGVSESAVKLQRQKRESIYERRGMPPEALRDLGQLTDMAVALKYGRSYDTARAWRIKAGLPAVVQYVRWSRAELAKLGTMPDGELARELGRRASHVKAKREALKIAPFKS